MYAKYEEELKEKSDLIVVCYHGGFEKSLDENMSPTESLTKENQGSDAGCLYRSRCDCRYSRRDGRVF